MVLLSLSNLIYLSRYTYMTQDETGSEQIIGYILDFLDGGGYTVDLNLYLH